MCLLECRKYDPVELLDTVEREKVNGLVIVGDPFSRPLLAAHGCGARPVGPELADDGDLVGRDVERAHQAGAACAPPRDAVGRRIQLVGGLGDGRVGVGRRLGGEDGVVHARAGREGADRGRAARGAGLGRGRRPRSGRPESVGVLQGHGEVGPHVQGDRRGALLDPRRLRGGRRRRDDPSARAGLGLHQLGRREDLPRGGRGGAEDARSVRDAVVVGIPHETYGEQIIAVVELVDGDGSPGARRRRPS